MDRKHKVGQRIVAGLSGTRVDDAFRALVRESAVGNVILFRRNIESSAQLARLCGEIRDLILTETGVPPLITIDQEGGVVARLTADLPHTPGGMALAAAGPDAPARAARIVARELRSVGINCNLAPVFDVNSNPDNPVIGVRSFGDEARAAAPRALAFARATAEEGVLPCAKHFPGHGDTAVDSHLGLPCVTKSRRELESCELLPFRAAVEAGVPAIMSSHILFPALEPERIPATMSRRILTDLLRGELGHQGLILSDCMEMDAIAKYYGSVNGAVAAVGAGVDLVFLSHTAAYARDTARELCRRYESGEFPEEELDASVARILAAKERFAATAAGPACTDADRQEARRLLEASFTLVRGELPPLGPRPVFIGCANYRATLASSGPEGVPAFPAYMAQALGGNCLLTGEDPDEGEIARAVQAAREASSVWMGSYNGHLRPGQLALMKALGGCGLPMAVVALRDPYDLASAPAHAAAIAAWEYTPQSLEALVPFLQGKIPFTGKIPVTL